LLVAMKNNITSNNSIKNDASWTCSPGRTNVAPLLLRTQNC